MNKITTYKDRCGLPEDVSTTAGVRSLLSAMCFSTICISAKPVMRCFFIFIYLFFCPAKLVFHDRVRHGGKELSA